MRTIVRFRTATGEWAVPVEHAREVRAAASVRLLPGARPGVAGILERDGDVVPVLSLLGDGDRHVLVLDAPGEHGAVAVLADQVTGVRSVGDDAVGPPPRGQEGGLVAGTIGDESGMVLLVDVGALAARAGR